VRTQNVAITRWIANATVALLPVLACFLGGSTQKWEEGIVITVFAICLLVRPPRFSLGLLTNLVKVGGSPAGKLLADADFDYLKEEIPRALNQSLEGVDRVAKIVRAMKEFSHPAREKTATDLNRAIQSTITVASNPKTRKEKTQPLSKGRNGEKNRIMTSTR